MFCVKQLWKMQQVYREKLQAGVGLKRWEIGELAARIGQLYYSYYLRTSDVNYLREAYNFYSAIRARGYFKCEQTAQPVSAGPAPVVPVGVSPVKVPSGSSSSSSSSGAQTPRMVTVVLMRNLRYHARFVLVCLLLGVENEVLDPLVNDMSLLVMKYKTECHPSHSEARQWQSLLEEVKAFQQSRAVIGVRDATGKIVRVLSGGRVQHLPQPTDAGALSSPPLRPVSILAKTDDDAKRFALHAAVLVSTAQDRVKYSELTLSTSHIMHSLELDPRAVAAAAASGTGASTVPAHPQKFILYEASPLQVLNHLASLCSTLPLNAGLMLYISADGDAERGGFRLAADAGRTQSAACTTLAPADVVPFTRMPLFVVADSDNSHCLARAELPYGERHLFLLSPTRWVATVAGSGAGRGLFTLFLHAPLSAFCLLCGLTNVDAAAYSDAQTLLRDFLDRVVDAPVPPLPGGADRLLDDVYVKTFVARFLFAHATLAHFEPTCTLGPEYLPLATPALDPLLHSVPLHNLVLRVASILGVSELFVSTPSCATTADACHLNDDDDDDSARFVVPNPVLSDAVPADAQHAPPLSANPPPLPPEPSPRTPTKAIRILPTSYFP